MLFYGLSVKSREKCCFKKIFIFIILMKKEFIILNIVLLCRILGLLFEIYLV